MEEIELSAKKFAKKCSDANMRAGFFYRYDDLDMINAFKEGADWQKRQCPWIDIEEREPKDQEMVLVTDEYWNKAAARFQGHDTGFVVYGGDAHKAFGDIVYWMPIPEIGW